MTRVPTGDACSQDGCERPGRRRGYCTAHYQRLYSGTDMDKPVRERIGRITQLECDIPQCSRVPKSKGLCGTHYIFKRKYALTTERLLGLYGNRECRNPGCGSLGPLHLDHDHSCCPGAESCGSCVRGWLCASCNQALGMLGEDPKRIEGLLLIVQRGLNDKQIEKIMILNETLRKGAA